MTSRAVQYRRFGGPEVLEVVEREDPSPASGQVRLAVRAAGVNPLDWKLRRGLMSSDDAPPEPRVPGFDVAGVVEELGEGVTSVAVGDEVLGSAIGGSYAERALAKADTLVAKPGALDWPTAAAVVTGLTTAYRALALVGLGEGDHTGSTLVVDGASGGVGTMVVQLAVSRGVTVIGTAGQARQDEVRALGATPTVYGEGLVERVRELAPQGVDAALDLAGKGSLPDLVALTGSADRVVTIADGSAAEHGVTFSSGGPGQGVPGALADGVARLADGRLRAPTVHTYTLDEAGRAQDDNESGRVPGKLVLVM